MEITSEMVQRVLEIVDIGLGERFGNIPGELCAQRAVCYALGEGNGLNPSCVSPALSHLLGGLSQLIPADNNTERARLMRRALVAQLGTAGTLNEMVFALDLSQAYITRLMPSLLRTASNIDSSNSSELLQAAENMEEENNPRRQAARLASARLKLEQWSDPTGPVCRRWCKVAEIWSQIGNAAGGDPDWTIVKEATAPASWIAHCIASIWREATPNWKVQAEVQAELAEMTTVAAQGFLSAIKANRERKFLFGRKMDVPGISKEPSNKNEVSRWVEAIVDVLTQMRTPGSYYLDQTLQTAQLERVLKQNASPADLL